MALYDSVRDLPLTIDAVETDVLSFDVSPEFVRKTTVIHLAGGGHEGIGEDVTYAAEEHEPGRFPTLGLAGDWTFDSFSSYLDSLNLFPTGDPDQAAYRDYRRWGFESAALDLALRQAGRSLGEAVGREPQPVTFVSSGRAVGLEGWLALYPDLRFKLDAAPEWTDELVAELAARRNVDVIDLKGQYHGTVVDQPPDAELYQRVAEGFPDAWIEDPGSSPESDAALEPHRDRITWDAPIHSVEDVQRLAWAPKCLNVKPSRFGPVKRLFDFYDYCEEHGIELYGGGQFELGPGRGQIQLLAALFCPHGSNDVAPGGYNAAEPLAGLETSPLDPRASAIGFRREV